MSAVCYACLRLLIKAVGRLCFRFQSVGQDLVPKQGGVLIAANHASYLDIPFLGVALQRRAAFLGRQDLFPMPGIHWLCRWLGWIPIRQNRLDREGFAKAINLIKEGRVVVIYPEGTRTLDGTLGPGKPGLGVIVAETGCRVVPAYIAGTYEALPTEATWVRFHPIKVVFGPPIDFSADATRLAGKEFFRHVSRTVMARIAELGQVPDPGVTSEPTEPDPASRSLNAE